ncbi:hypothetical protein OYE22_14810 [Streptomyces sp. 71268]|uniref:hypothetical protein n=1 Tax=Streptomyces sp. 71268 TaxID=3002640 RepID=UPI0023FA2ACB|nr:hypothetical protein [Streptomyces sp. 71268]WEV26327.1 hypothetical protein OYE22_14810 [Streptomyces sp. 71268]
MAWVQTLSWVVAVSLGVLACRWASYPGSWVAMFGAEYAKPRGELRRVREELTAARRASAHRLEAATERLRVARAAYQAEVDGAERRLRSLRAPAPGSRVTWLGRIAVHEEALRLFDEDGPLDETGRHRTPASGPSTDLPLATLTVDCAPSDDPPETCVTLTSGNSVSYEVGYAHREYPEANVRQFVSDVRSAVARAREAQAAREQHIAAAEADLAAARAATEDVDAARTRVERVRTAERVDPEVRRAADALEAQRDRWHAITGRRPWR